MRFSTEVTTFLLSMSVALAATGVAVPLLRRAEVWDIPNARSSHRRAVPRGGGVGVAAGVLVAVLATGVTGDSAVVLVAALGAAALGLLDDFRGLPALMRLSAQLVLGAGVGAWLLRDEPYGPVVRTVALVLTLLWLVGFLNAFNFMDGINGISACSAAVAGGWYAWLGYADDVPSLSVIGLSLAGAAVGFAPWNALRAMVFLGDVGSYGIGMLIAGLALVALLTGSSLLEAGAPLVVYLVDTAWALIKRVRRGDSWREAHREHVYQRLVDGGWSHSLTAVLVATLAAGSCVVVALLPTSGAVAIVAAIALAYLAMPALVLRNEPVSL